MFGNLFERKSKRIGSRRKHDRRGDTGGTLSERFGGRLSRDENVGSFSARVEMLEERKVLAAFTDGNLVVLRVGDGTTALSSSATVGQFVEFSTSGSIVNNNIVNIPAQPKCGKWWQIMRVDARQRVFRRHIENRFLGMKRKLGHIKPIDAMGVHGWPDCGWNSPQIFAHQCALMLVRCQSE